MDIGKKIRAARVAKGMTQQELGALLGVKDSAIAKYESGRVVNIKRSTLKKISDILGIEPVELIVENVEKSPLMMTGYRKTNANLLTLCNPFRMTRRV